MPARGVERRGGHAAQREPAAEASGGGPFPAQPAFKKELVRPRRAAGAGVKAMAAEKMETLRLVAGSDLGVRPTLRELSVAPRTFYRWYRGYTEHGFQGLKKREPAPRDRSLSRRSCRWPTTTRQERTPPWLHVPRSPACSSCGERGPRKSTRMGICGSHDTGLYSLAPCTSLHSRASRGACLLWDCFSSPVCSRRARVTIPLRSSRPVPVRTRRLRRCSLWWAIRACPCVSRRC